MNDKQNKQNKVQVQEQNRVQVQKAEESETDEEEDAEEFDDEGEEINVCCKCKKETADLIWKEREEDYREEDYE
jgi:hypothetical protein